MARKPGAAAPAPHQINDEAVASASEANAERATHLMAIDHQFGGVAVYDKERVIEEARFYIRRGADAFIEAGKRLILLKEHEGHGNFITTLDRIGIAQRTASRFMLVAATTQDRPALADLSATRIAELAVLDGADLDTLEAGGSVSDLTLDDFARMSVRELVATVREMKEEATANEELLAAKTKKIDSLAKKLARLPDVRAWNEESAALVDEIGELVKKVGPQLGALNERIEQLGAMMAESTPTMEEGKATAIVVMNAVHLLVNLLAPAQIKMYEEFQNYVPVTHTSLYKPQE